MWFFILQKAEILYFQKSNTSVATKTIKATKTTLYGNKRFYTKNPKKNQYFPIFWKSVQYWFRYEILLKKHFLTSRKHISWFILSFQLLLFKLWNFDFLRLFWKIQDFYEISKFFHFSKVDDHVARIGCWCILRLDIDSLDP